MPNLEWLCRTSAPDQGTRRFKDESGFPELLGDAARWPGIDIVIRGQRWRCEGNDFAAIERRKLLGLLTSRAGRAGVTLRHQAELRPGAPELDEADVVVVADGANSLWRKAESAALAATEATSSARFIWLAAAKTFDGMTFLFEENEHGWLTVHAHPYNHEHSTFAVETDETTWRAAALDQFDTTQPPAPPTRQPKPCRTS